MNKDSFAFNLIDDGMIHQFVIKDGKMHIRRNPFGNKIFDSKNPTKHGFLAIEDNQVVNEGGNLSEKALSEFHGRIVVK